MFRNNYWTLKKILMTGLALTIAVPAPLGASNAEALQVLSSFPGTPEKFVIPAHLGEIETKYFSSAGK